MKGLELTIYGRVQGIGFRPFLAELAEGMGLAGDVQNKGGIVRARIYGEGEKVSSFERRMRSSLPEGADLLLVEKRPWDPPVPPSSFQILPSEGNVDRLRFLPPDIGTCRACEKELLDPGDRRYLYPFISCTTCGPRFTVMRSLPYDRERTTMDRFPLCPSCQEDYKEKGGRRRHGQTIACASCGPTLTLYRVEGTLTGPDALKAGIRDLKAGSIAAIKDIGGFHLAFRADSIPAADRLRVWKAREEKPFAVMFPDLLSIKRTCKVSKKEEDLLLSPARPIVLLEARYPGLWPGVLGGSDRLGAFLPSDPLQILLLRRTGPLVMTSGNRGGEPIATDGAFFLKTMREEGLPDLVLDHDREILTPLDDSILQVTPLSGGRETAQVLRRARGIVPDALLLPKKLPRDTFAGGGDLKNVFAFGRDRFVWAGGHFGDLIVPACRKARKEGIRHLGTLLGQEVSDETLTIGDLHPAYYSGKGADLRVQHHLAHVLSTAAENGLDGPFIGCAFDGTGYGTDHTVWGSEILFVRPKGKDLLWDRAGHLLPFLLTGGDEGARDGKAIADAMMRDLRRRWKREGMDGKSLPFFYGEREEDLLSRADEAHVNRIHSTSMGRLFDAAAFVTGASSYNHYEGESPIKLEEKAHLYLRRTGEDPYFPREEDLSLKLVRDKDLVLGDGEGLLYSLYQRKKEGGDIGFLSLLFHRAVARWTFDAVEALDPEREYPVCLSGGTFSNRLLLALVEDLFSKAGRQVYWNRSVPSGDGGLFLGQMYAGAFHAIIGSGKISDKKRG